MNFTGIAGTSTAAGTNIAVGNNNNNNNNNNNKVLISVISCNFRKIYILYYLQLTNIMLQYQYISRG